MNIYPAATLLQLDAACMRTQQISSDMLMERAAVTCVHHILALPIQHPHFVITCGIGNNGGDGLCIARMLHLKGYRVTVLMLGDMAKATADTQLNYRRLQKYAVDIFHISEGNRIPWFEQVTIVDALFGIGMNRPVEGWLRDCISDINAMDALRIAVDMPSGLPADMPLQGIAVEADHTITFTAPKLSFFFPESYPYTGKWQVADIGVFSVQEEAPASDMQWQTLETFHSGIPARPVFAHKGHFGHACVIAGSAGMPGAAALTAMACLTTGAGLVTLCSDVIEFTDPEIMYATRDTLVDLLHKKSFAAVAIGPGLGTDAQSIAALSDTLAHYTKPMVIDADAINALSKHTTQIAQIPKYSILTPHPKEFERLAGASSDWHALLEKLKHIARAWQCYFVYKQAYTIIVSPEGHITFNGSGNVGMATAGSGDVLTGIICGLLSQGYTPERAATLGVFLHGYAGDLAMQAGMGQNLVAGDILQHIQQSIGLLLDRD